jgi:SOS-response transcriptional repressor LexA
MSAAHVFKHLQASDVPLIINLQALMHEGKINEAELSRQTKIPQPTLHKILSGKTADPRISTLKTLAHYFHVSLDDLCEGVVLQEANSAVQGLSVPVISWSDCLSAHPVEHLSPANWTEWVVVDHMDSTQLYGLSVRPSMAPRFPKGTLLIVDPDLSPSDGDLVILRYPDTTEAALRELLIDGPLKQLMSVSQHAGCCDWTDDVEVIGTVIQSRFSYQD